MIHNLTVVTHKRWLAAELCKAADTRNWTARQDYGFDVPELDDLTVLWMPTAHAARIVGMGLELPLLSIPSDWLSNVPYQYVQREIVTMEVSQLLNWELWQAGFAKLSTVKTDRVPAQWWKNMYEFQSALEAIEAPQNTSIQVCPTYQEFVNEYRVVIIDHEAVSVSRYLPESDHEAYDTELDEAMEFAHEVAQHMAQASPRTYMMDIGTNAIGEYLVIEANNTWSSNPYDNDPSLVVQALLVAYDRNYRDTSYWYEPDPLDAFLAAKKPPLHDAVPINMITN
jgi:hypothetical protein